MDSDSDRQQEIHPYQGIPKKQARPGFVTSMTTLDAPKPRRVPTLPGLSSPELPDSQSQPYFSRMDLFDQDSGRYEDTSRNVRPRKSVPITVPIPASPSSTISESSQGLNNPNRSSTAPVLTPRRIVIKADPTMMTCFDPKDKELYDLWASGK